MVQPRVFGLYFMKQLLSKTYSPKNMQIQNDDQHLFSYIFGFIGAENLGQQGGVKK